jgi:chromate transporter
MNLLTFFWLFLKGSLFSTGGLGNLPFLHKDLLALGWAHESDFITAIAVGNVSPGPTGLWSISLGYLTFGLPGAVLALLALVLPTLLILVVSAFYNRIEKHPAVKNFTTGLALSIVGLTITVALGLAKSSIQDWSGVVIAIAALGLALSKKVPVILILVLAGLAGFLLYGM